MISVLKTRHLTKRVDPYKKKLKRHCLSVGLCLSVSQSVPIIRAATVNIIKTNKQLMTKYTRKKETT